MSVDLEIPTHLNMRINAKVRYLAEIAARVQGVSLTEYIEAAIVVSFRDVYPIGKPHDLETNFKDRVEELAPPEDSLAHYADALWDENPGVRLALRSGEHEKTLMREDERIVFSYILSRPEFATKGKLNTRAIADHWEEIQEAAITEDRKTRKAGNKKGTK